MREAQQLIDSFSGCERELISQLVADLSVQLKDKHKRFVHSMGVATCALELSHRFNVNSFNAVCAGLLHDWHKAYSSKEQISLAQELDIDLDVDFKLVAPLLHGLLTARVLPAHYPWLDSSIFQAIERHTIGAVEMSPLDMVLFVSDAIEPNRPDNPSIQKLRSMIEYASLEDLYVEAFCDSVVYVIQTNRYLWPKTIETYNKLIAKNH